MYMKLAIHLDQITHRTSTPDDVDDNDGDDDDDSGGEDFACTYQGRI